MFEDVSQVKITDYDTSKVLADALATIRHAVIMFLWFSVLQVREEGKKAFDYMLAFW